MKSWVLNDLKTQEERIALDILEYILVVSEASPLRKLLLDSGLGEDLFGGYDPNYLQHVFMLGLKGANESDLEKIEKL